MPRIRNNRIPYDAHPLYRLRRRTLIAATIGVLLNLIVILALSDSYRGQDRLPFFVIATIVLGGSIAFVSYDVVTYGTRAAMISATQTGTEGSSLTISHPPELAWPSKTLLVWDFIFAGILQWVFWCGLFDIVGRSYYDRYSSSETLEAYANLANFVTSVLHAIAFWKELIARKRTQWQRDLNKQPCVHCGHVASKQDEAPVNDITGEEQAGSSRRPMLSNVSKVGKVVLPKWARAANIFYRRDDTKDRDVEHEAANDDVGEPFLATPEESTEDTAGPSGTYGAISQSVESLRSIPETIVRQKDKGKKRLVDVE